MSFDTTVVYFSGTGNSKFIAERFAARMGAVCYSIEEDCDFAALFAQSEMIAFVYPIYGSRVPKIMREFVNTHASVLGGKNLILFVTQSMFSGDGARCFLDLLPRRSAKVVYAEHFIMPNNIGNTWFLPKQSNKTICKLFAKAEAKLECICRDIRHNKTKKRGFNPLSRLLGLSQGLLLPHFEKRWINTVRIGEECTNCGLCVFLCPTKNLERKSGSVIPLGNCTLCYRCVNYCPQQAIRIMSKSKTKWQYRADKTAP